MSRARVANSRRPEDEDDQRVSRCKQLAHSDVGDGDHKKTRNGCLLAGRSDETAQVFHGMAVMGLLLRLRGKESSRAC